MDTVFKNWINRLVAFPEWNAKFINTLSFLEYVGSRKILKSQEASAISVELLTHIAEEIRHAQVLKRLVLKLSGGALTTYSDDHLLCGKEARIYVQQVDRAAVEELGSKSSWMNYLYTTLLLEERAGAIYPLYDQALEKIDGTRVFRGILKEEENHLQSIFGSFGAVPDVTEEKLNRLRALEEKAFGQFMASLIHSTQHLFAGSPQRHEVETARLHDSPGTHHTAHTAVNLNSL